MGTLKIEEVLKEFNPTENDIKYLKQRLLELETQFKKECPAWYEKDEIGR
jgi:hypothetical protein